MARRIFSLGEMINLDMGKIDAAFRMEMQRAVEDILDRPEDDADRTVMLKMKLRPEDVAQGNVDTVCVGFELDLKLPKKSTRAYSMRVCKTRSHAASLLFNSESPDDPNQMTLDEVTGELIPSKEDR